MEQKEEYSSLDKSNTKELRHLLELEYDVEILKMIDGYVYKIKTESLVRIISSNNINHEFWNNSKIKFVKNTTGIFLDVDEPRDLKMFEIYEKYIDEKNKRFNYNYQL